MSSRRPPRRECHGARAARQSRALLQEEPREVIDARYDAAYGAVVGVIAAIPAR